MTQILWRCAVCKVVHLEGNHPFNLWGTSPVTHFLVDVKKLRILKNTSTKRASSAKMASSCTFVRHSDVSVFHLVYFLTATNYKTTVSGKLNVDSSYFCDFLRKHFFKSLYRNKIYCCRIFRYVQFIICDNQHLS